ncbi:hypothetical protein PSACC_01220 [Paramicrosporidium saccamoebae]|uniref:RUN domain-containing protein n=1 Tax=Paramicrosporidium saccamoebae TaxID=1246581 RepID=A0A2H9TMH2_9FUNG|nr:hypothetical protein PSACC_01220 [Paramicrosporidium saccamoebae]
MSSTGTEVLSIVPKLDATSTTLSLESHDYLLRLERTVAQFNGTITQWNESCMQLINLLGELFRTGLRKSFAQSIFTAEPSFWQFVREFTAPETVRQLRELPKQQSLFKNPIERENAWLMQSLNHGDLGMYISVIKRNRKLVKTFYSESGGSIFLEEDAMDVVMRLIDTLLERTKYKLDIDEYVRFLEERNSAPVPPSVEDTASTEKGSRVVYSPVPIVQAPMAALEDAVGEEERAPYVSKFRDFIDHPSDSGGTTEIEPDESTEEVVTAPVDVLEGRAVDDKIPENVIEKNLNNHHEPDRLSPVLTPLAFAGDRRELLYTPSPHSLQMEEGTNELHSIITKRTTPQIVVLDSNQKVLSHPAIFETPTIGSSDRTRASSALSFPSEYGFFAVPLDLGTLSGVLYPIKGLLARVARMAMITIGEGGLDDACSNDSYHTSSLLDPSLRRSFRQYPKSDGFNYNLRPSPDDGLDAQNNVCFDCKKSSNVRLFKLCDISGKHYCSECFGEGTLESPARILKNGDFERRPVAKRVIQEYSRHFPVTLFTLSEIESESLYDKLPALKQLENLRNKVALALEHAEFCATGIYNDILVDYTGSRHMVLSTDMYTINDLIHVHSGGLMEDLARTQKELSNHIKRSCANCQLGGRYCEMCNNGEPIFRFDTDYVRECPRCEMLTHVECAESIQGCMNCRRAYMAMMSPYIEPAMLEID